MRLNKVAWPVLVLGLSAPMMLDCAAKDALEGCDEFDAGTVASLSVDAKAKAFVQAAADLKVVATRMTADVKTACAAIATDLGATDTWSALSGNDQISNGSAGACDVAASKIKEVLQANASVKVAVTVSGGQCSVDASLQAECEASCKADVSCTEPSLEVRCKPGELSGQCSGTCNATATCEGSATLAAQCQGTCSATCTGTCSGKCEGKITGGCTGTCEGKCDGVATPAGGQANCAGTCEGTCSAPALTATCEGKCSASCKGTCSGNCTLDATANINCGANVSCKGGCSVAYTAPKCEGELNPPQCAGDASCQGSCSGRAEMSATCTPPTVNVVITGDATGLAALQATLQTNLPKLWLAAKTQGQLALQGAIRVGGLGGTVVANVTSMGGKALACAGVAAQAAISAQASVNVSVQASVSVSGSANAS